MDDETRDRIFDAIENGLTMAGFEIMDTDGDTMVVRDAENDMDFEINIEEIPV